ncbi:MAG: hypothetical protein WC343_14485 [Bacilli bacterium]|jgi:hypothetical protein
MTNKQYVYRNNQIRVLKDGINLKEYLVKHPDAYAIGKPPTETTLERWDNDGYCKALDGCRVEPDGTCEHGKPSWLIAMGMI